MWWAAACVLVAVSIGEEPSVERRAQPTPPRSATVQRRDAQRLLDRGELGEAIAVATDAAELAPDDTAARASLSMLRSMASPRPETRATHVALIGHGGALLHHVPAEPAVDGRAR